MTWIEEVLPPLKPPRVDQEAGPEERKLDFEHRFVAGEDVGTPPTLLLLHGTGGDETDLIPLGDELAPGSRSLRGWPGRSTGSNDSDGTREAPRRNGQRG